jgi:hypothetical protein
MRASFYELTMKTSPFAGWSVLLAISTLAGCSKLQTAASDAGAGGSGGSQMDASDDGHIGSGGAQGGLDAPTDNSSVDAGTGGAQGGGDGAADVGAAPQSGSILWARSGAGASLTLLAAAEGPGGVVATGTFSSSANLGGQPLNPAGESDALIAEFAASDGAPLYSSRFGGGSPAGSGSVTGFVDFVDAQGGAFIHGFSNCDPNGTPACNKIDVGLGFLDPGGGPEEDGFIGRYAVTNAQASWVARLVGPGGDHFASACAGPNGSLYVTGWYDQSTTLISGNATRTFIAGGDRDVVIAQLDQSTGAIGMTKTFAGPSREEPQAIAWTGSEIVVTGTFSGSMTIGTKTLTSAGDLDIWIAKLMADGTPVWSTSLGGSGTDRYPAMALDSSGDIYIDGTVGAPAMFGTYNVGGAGGLDTFVAKIRNVDGSVAWATSFGSVGNDTTGFSSIAINSSGEILVTGTIAGPLTAGGQSSGGLDAVLASYDRDGTRLWTKIVGTTSDDYGFTVASGAGGFYWVIDLGADIGSTVGGTPIQGPTPAAALLIKLQP